MSCKLTITIECGGAKDRIEELQRVLDLISYQLSGSSINNSNVVSCGGQVVDADRNRIGVWSYDTTPTDRRNN